MKKLFLYPALALAGICSGTVHAAQIEAENYSAMSGVEAEATTDVGSGQNIGFIQNGDWTEYQIDVPAAGVYEIELRVASRNGGGTVNLSTQGTSLGSVVVDSTGDWQDWVTLTTTATFASAGPQTLRMDFFSATSTNSLLNMNWFSFEEPPAPPILIEAEDFTAMNGVQIEVGNGATTDSIGFIVNGDWAEYAVDIPAAGDYRVSFSAASRTSGGEVDIVVGGSTLGSVSIPGTGDWANWTSFASVINFPNAGPQTIRLNFVSDENTNSLYNIDSFEIAVPEVIELFVGNDLKQQMRYGLDYERLWFWFGSAGNKDRVAQWSVIDCDIEYVRVAVNAGYELTENNYDLSAYTNKIIPMMQDMQTANPDIKFFASPRPLDEATNNVAWQPYPQWITGSTGSSSNFDFDWEEASEYLIRYLRLMKSNGFQISFLDVTNEWQSSSSGTRVTPGDARDMHEYMLDYVNNPPSPDPTDPTGFYSTFPTLTLEDIPEFVGPSAWNYDQGRAFINNVNTDRERAALPIASCHNTDRTGTAQEFADAARSAMGEDVEIWNTEVHGWKSTSNTDEVLSFAYMLEGVRAGFTGLSGWLAIGTPNQGHSYILNSNGTPTRNVKYYIFEKLSNTSHRGHALDINQPDEFAADTLDADSATMALIRGNLMTVWLTNLSGAPILTDLNIGNRTISDANIKRTRWREVDGSPENLEGEVDFVTASNGNTIESTVDALSLYCYEILLEPEGVPFVQIEAESFDSSSPVDHRTENTTDVGAGLNLSNIENGDWVCFEDIEMIGSESIRFRVARPAGRADGVIEVRLDSETGPVIGRTAVPETGGWQVWETIETPLDAVTGTHDLYLNFIVAESNEGSSANSLFNLNSFSLPLVEATPTPSAPLSLTAGPVNAGQIDLGWSIVDGATGYNVKRSTASGGSYSQIGNVTTTNYADTVNLTPGTRYYYVVSSLFETVESTNSNEASAVPSDELVLKDVVIDSMDFTPSTGGAGDKVSFSVANSGLGLKYQLYSSETLENQEWTPASSVFVGNGGALEISDILVDAQKTKCFYRLQVSRE